MPKVAVATTSALAADAARDIIDAGGNAVDAALCAALVTMNTEPGVCALAGGAYINVWPAGGAPVAIDGYVAIPGLGMDRRADAQASTQIEMQYGGGVTTTIGAASVAVPGTLAAVEQARQRYGNLPLNKLMQPSIDAARDGFPLSFACHHYLQYSGQAIFGRDPVSRRALHPDDTTLLGEGQTVLLPGLADSLQAIADEGIALFYHGELARVISSHIVERGGVLSREDLASYEVHVRPALQIAVGDWQVAMPPPPAIGGAMLGAVLSGVGKGETLLNMLRRTLQYRRSTLDFSKDLPSDCRSLLEAAHAGGALLGNTPSASTVHTSAVDSNGLACAITASAGYGSGEMPAATGLWLNNCLGELELNRHGLEAAPASMRLPSNMAPTTAHCADRTLAIGSPGADRITSALAQTLQHFMLASMDLGAAIDAPRMHVEVALQRASQDEQFAETLCLEPGVAVAPVDTMTRREYDAPSMYFGGVGAALYDAQPTANPSFVAVADPRRTGGTCIHASNTTSA